MNTAAPPFPFAGEIASLGAACIWAVSMSLFRAFGRTVPASTMNLFKVIIAMGCLVVVAIVMAPEIPREPWVYGMLGLSGIVGLSLGDTALFAALKRLGAQVTSASQCLAPPLAAAIALFAFDESLSLFEAIGLVTTVVAITGVIFFSKRGAELGQLTRDALVLGLVFALISAFCQAIAVVTQRGALQHANVIYGTMMRLGPALVILFLMTLVGKEKGGFREIFAVPRRALFLGLAAFMGTFIGLLLMSTGAKYAKAGVAAALSSTYPIWIIPIARVFLKESTNWQTVLCTVCACVGIALLFY